MSTRSAPNSLVATWRLAPCATILIGINLVVFLLFTQADRGSALETFLIENFLVSTAHLEAGHVWTLVTSGFAHMELWHLGINMFVLWSFGLVLERLWGSRIFLTIYLLAAVAGSAGHCLGSSLLMGDGTIPALGASGATSGLLITYGLTFPRSMILVFGILPVPALVGVAVFVGLDVWGLVAQSRGGGLSIGHGAHLGGALTGGLIWLFYLRTRFRIDPRPAPPYA